MTIADLRRAWPLLLCSIGLACAASGRPAAPPSPAPPAVGPLDEPERIRTPGGLHVVMLPAPASDSAFSAALLFAAGPLDDPAAHPGLTAIVADAALLGTAGDPDRDRPPPERALAAGALLEPIASGGVVGWGVVGAAGDADRLVTLLADVARRPTFPATRLDAQLEMTREALEADGRSEVRRALAVALGVALGLARPLGLAPDPRTLGGLHREEIVRHHRRVVRADRGVLVLRGGPAGLADRLPEALTEWRDEAPAPKGQRVCPPTRRTAHVVVAPEPGARLLTLVTVAAPGPGAPGRAALEAALAWAGGSPAGPIERLVGPERARQARPELVDLGPGPEGGVSVLLMGVADEARPALLDLLKVVEWLDHPGAGEAGAALDEGRLSWWGARAAEREDPVRALVTAGTRLLYGAPPAATPSRDDVAQALDAPGWRRGLVVTGVGHPRLAEVLGTLAPVTLWSDDGAVIGGAPPPACRGRGPHGDGSREPQRSSGVDAPRQSP